MPETSMIKRKMKYEGPSSFFYSAKNRVLLPIIQRRLRKYYSENRDSLVLDNASSGFLIKHRNLDEFYNPLFFINPGIRKNYRTLYEKYYSKELELTIRSADKILSGDYSEVFHGCPSFAGIPDWQCSFSDKGSWPLDFFQDYDYLSVKGRDIRLNWEFNRHQYFYCLGKAYLLTGDEKYTEEFLRQCLDWIDRNPVAFGPGWLQGQETSLRMTSWIWAYYFFFNSPLFTSEKKAKILGSICRHAEFTHLYRLRSHITHNHIITEMCGLGLFALAFPEFKKSKKYLRLARKSFSRECKKQIWDEGPSAERSTAYHFFVLDSFLMFSVLLIRNGIKPSDAVSGKIAGMIDYAQFIIGSNGTIPLFGDNDSGRTHRLFSEKNFASFLSTGAALFGRGDFKSSAGKFFEESFWLLGEQGLQKFGKLQEFRPVKNYKLCKDTGMAFIKAENTDGSPYLAFRAAPGRIRKSVSFSHNHADFLSLELRHNGHAILQDPGNYTYGKDDDLRYYFRSGRSHSVPMLDLRDCADIKGRRFGLGEISTGKIELSTQENKAFRVIMSYSPLPGFLISRTVFYCEEEKFMVLLDAVSGNGIHKLSSNFTLGTDCLKAGNNGAKIVFDGKKEAEILFEEDSDMEIFPGFSSSTYNELHSVKHIRQSKRAELPISLLSLISLGDQEPPSITTKAINRESVFLRLFTKDGAVEIYSAGNTFTYRQEVSH